MEAEAKSSTRWLRTGDEAFATMQEMIRSARESVRLEMYIFKDCPLAERIREELVAAQKRGAKVEILLDAWGSQVLPDGFWSSLEAAGGTVRWFNPLALDRLGYRDHRKMLVVDRAQAVVGGFNIAPEYEGDGITRGWRDYGVVVQGKLAKALAEAFDEFFCRTGLKQSPFLRLRKTPGKYRWVTEEGELLLGGPGRGVSALKRSLHQDLKRPGNVRLTVAYFLPTWRIWRSLLKTARRGGRVQLVLPAHSDVPLSQLAGQSLYRRLLRAGVEIYEYEPQPLHAKLFIIDQAVYVGSANLDKRSLGINYELLLRLTDPALVAEAGRIFADDLTRCRKIELAEWKRSRTLWQKLKQRWAYFVLGRLDPFIAQRQLEALR